MPETQGNNTPVPVLSAGVLIEPEDALLLAEKSGVLARADETDARGASTRIGFWALLLAPILVPLWCALVLGAWSFAVAAWSVLRDAMRF